MTANNISLAKIKAIIFDVDGVIFKSLDINGKYLWSNTIKQDFGLSKTHFQRIYGADWDALVTTGKIDTKEHLDKIFKDPLFKELGLTADKYVNYWLEHDNFVDNEMIAYINTLSVPVYLGTNQDKYRTAHIESLVGCYFNGFFTSYRIGHLKPSELFYKHIELSLNLKADELLLIDDTLANVTGAQLLGWESYWYQGDLDNLKEFLGALSCTTLHE